MAEERCGLCNSTAESRTSERFPLDRVSCKTCGRYNTDGVTLNIQNHVGDKAYILSALTRRASDAGNPITVTSENVGSLVESIPIPTTLEKLDRALLSISQLQKRADEFVSVNPDKNYPLAFARDGEEYLYLLRTLADRGLLDRRELPMAAHIELGEYRLTPEGWEAAERLRKSQPDSDQAFVAMWFTDELKEAWEQGFKPGLEATGFTPIRIDLVEHSGKIDDLIVSEIRRSGLLVADFTGNRGGVYFEAGFAMGLGIPIIWTCKDSDIAKVHFDTRQYNHIVWTNPQDLREKLQNRIAATIPGKQVRR